MDKNNYDRYQKFFDDYVRVYDIPTIKSHFFQNDHHAMQYCSNRDFITLIVPFGDPESAYANQIFVQNNLVSYIQMYSSLYGGSVNDDSQFINSALSVVREKTKNNKLVLDELYPIAILENLFEYKNIKRCHRGIVFVARINRNSVLDKNVVSRSLADKFYFSNPHNKALFQLVKEYVENYRINKDLIGEIVYSRKTKSEINKKKKVEFLKEKNFFVDDYLKFKERIIKDISALSPDYIIDVACGDDDIIYDFLNIKSNINVFANDIALAYIENYHLKKEKSEKINFSNLNAVSLPFKENSFDVLFCKNLLHHLSKKDQVTFIDNAMKISKTMVLVEILSLDEQNQQGRVLHNEFYKKRLGESKYKKYLHSKDIDQLLKRYNCSLNEKVETGNGVYKYVHITKR